MFLGSFFLDRFFRIRQKKVIIQDNQTERMKGRSSSKVCSSTRIYVKDSSASRFKATYKRMKQTLISTACGRKKCMFEADVAYCRKRILPAKSCLPLNNICAFFGAAPIMIIIAEKKTPAKKENFLSAAALIQQQTHIEKKKINPVLCQVYVKKSSREVE